MPEILARRVGEKVLCGMLNKHGIPTCGGELARVEEWHGIPLLCIPDGWKRKPFKVLDHWALTSHSVSLRDVAASKVSRGKLEPNQAVARARPRNRRPIDRPDRRDTYLVGYGLRSVSAVFESISIPAAGILSDCPQCGHVNTLKAAPLGIASR
jgi:hypothetical protein